MAAIDLGGGSVQQAFAVSAKDASAAPEGYITQLSGGGRAYHVYVHRCDAAAVKSGLFRIVILGLFRVGKLGILSERSSDATHIRHSSCNGSGHITACGDDPGNPTTFVTRW